MVESGRISSVGLSAALVLTLLTAGSTLAQYPAVQPDYVVPYGNPVYVPPRAVDHNPVGFGFGGYSYGEYPAYGFNGYLPAAYDGFNTPRYPGAARATSTTGYRGMAVQRSQGGNSQFTMSDAWTGNCGATGCRMGYRAP